MATKIDTKNVENYLSNLGRKDSKKKILFQRVLFDIKTTKNGVEIVLDSPDHETVLKNFKSQMIKTLMEKFKGSLDKDYIKKPKVGKVLRLKYIDKGTKYIDFEVREYPKAKDSKGGGTLPARISEPATRFILNAALKSKGKIFKTEEDIFVDDVYKDLEELFSNKWGHKLDSWIYTFLKQNELFFKNYGRITWSKFKHKDYKNERDMQVFFEEHLKTLEQSPGVRVGRSYTQWNPADIWAVKRSEQSTLEDEIETATKNPSADNLMKLNLHLVKLMEKKELVGISLKKIESGGTFKIYNVDSSKLLTNLKAFKPLTTFKMDDIHLELRNVFGNFPGKGGGVAATTYIYYGDKKFKVNVTRTTTGNLVFNTEIPSDKGAQGGQSLIQPLLKALKHDASNVTFNNKVKDYPQSSGEFEDIIENPKSPKYKLYKQWFNFVNKHPKNNYKNIKTFDEYTNNVLAAYNSRPKEGIAKLALLNFWYDALKNHDKDPQFWTDILYFGMKITTRGEFGPHAKIS